MQPSKTKSEHRISLRSFTSIINPFNTSQFKSSSLSYLLLPLLAGIFSAPSYGNENPNEHAATSDSKTIAITQIVTHPSADQTRIGVIDGLKESGFEGYRFSPNDALGLGCVLLGNLLVLKKRA